VTSRCLLVSALVPLLAAPGARAGSEWEVQITPYVWLAGMEGDVGPLRALSLRDVSLSFGDIWDTAGEAGVVFASARRGSWVVYADATALSVTAEEELDSARASGFTVDTSASALAVAVGRKVSKSDRHRVEVYAGVRSWWVSNDFDIDTAGPGTVRTGTDANWSDPLLGIAGRADLTARWALIGMAEIGGFGVGAHSEFSLLGGVTYSFSDRFGVSAAWRHMAVDYRDEDFVYDVRNAGPVIGATFRF
jgi:hypothetical protein